MRRARRDRPPVPGTRAPRRVVRRRGGYTGSILIIHLVTDRRRLGAATDGSIETCRHLVALVERAVAAGVDAVQLRERDMEARALASLAAELVARAAGSRTRIIVNDRLDVALAAGAHGVHLRGESIRSEAARAMAPKGFLIGRSVHSAQEARCAGTGVDYLIAGTVWASRSKGSGSPLLGTDGLRSIVLATQVPVLAIGGVTAGRIPELARSGAGGCAAIGLFIGEPMSAGPIAPAPGALADLVRRMRVDYERAGAA